MNKEDGESSGKSLDDTGSNTGSTTDEEDIEPVFSYYRMKNVVSNILIKNDDFASCMCVDSKVNSEIF